MGDVKLGMKPWKFLESKLHPRQLRDMGKVANCLFVNNIILTYFVEHLTQNELKQLEMSFAYGKVTRLIGVGIFQPCKCSKTRIHLPR